MAVLISKFHSALLFFNSICKSFFHSLSEMKMISILSALMRDSRFKGRGKWDSKVTLLTPCSNPDPKSKLLAAAVTAELSRLGRVSRVVENTGLENSCGRRMALSPSLPPSQPLETEFDTDTGV